VIHAFNILKVSTPSYFSQRDRGYKILSEGLREKRGVYYYPCFHYLLFLIVDVFSVELPSCSPLNLFPLGSFHLPSFYLCFVCLRSALIT
jgi:hypothetical protein